MGKNIRDDAVGFCPPLCEGGKEEEKIVMMGAAAGTAIAVLPMGLMLH